MPLVIPEESYESIHNLIALSDCDFSGLVDALTKVKPTLSPEALGKNVAALLPLVDTEIVEGIVREIFAMDIVRDDKEFSIDEFSDLLCQNLQQTKSITFSFTKDDALVFGTRIRKLFEVKKTMGISSKSLDLLTHQDRVFYSCQIITDVRPVFNDEGTSVEASIVIHNLRIHYGHDNGHRDFYIALDSGDIQKLRSVLDRAEKKTEYLKNLLQKSGVAYLDVNE